MQPAGRTACASEYLMSASCKGSPACSLFLFFVFHGSLFCTVVPLVPGTQGIGLQTSAAFRLPRTPGPSKSSGLLAPHSLPPHLPSAVLSIATHYQFGGHQIDMLIRRTKRCSSSSYQRVIRTPCALQREEKCLVEAMDANIAAGVAEWALRLVI